MIELGLFIIGFLIYLIGLNVGASTILKNHKVSIIRWRGKEKDSIVFIDEKTAKEWLVEYKKTYPRVDCYIDTTYLYRKIKKNG